MIRELSRFKNAILVSLAVILLTSGAVFAAVMVTKSVPGSITIVAPPSGGGGGGSGGTTYNFRVSPNPDGVATATDIHWNIPATGNATATVYLVNTGTGSLSVHVAPDALPAGITFSPIADVPLPVGVSVVPVALTMAADNTHTAGEPATNLNIVFTGNNP